jgi:nitroreductase
VHGVWTIASSLDAEQRIGGKVQAGQQPTIKRKINIMKNPTDHAIHDLLSTRWSPYAFDSNRDVSPDDLNALFEAARWSMSSYNAQPWRYIVGVRGRGQSVWDQVFNVLLEGNQPWAKNAPVLVLGLAEHNFEHNGQPNKAALHDLGAASASLTFEATARGLVVHQMIGIDPEKARETFALKESIEPLTALAVGYAGRSDVVGDEYAKRDARPRERKPPQDIILHGSL